MMNGLVQGGEQEILDSEHAGPPTLSVLHSSSGHRGISLPSFRLLSFLLFLIFFSVFSIIIIIILRLLEVTAKKWKNIKRRISPVFQVLPPWRAAKSGSISFKIRTNEPNGLIMYSRSGAHTRVCEFRSIYLFSFS